MKVAPFGLRGKELSLTLIVIICSTILIWTWDRTPLLAVFLPPKMRVLQLPQELQTDMRKGITSLEERETENNTEEQSSNFSSELQTNREDITAREEKDTENKREEHSSSIANGGEPRESSSYSDTTSVPKKDEEDVNERQIPEAQEHHHAETSTDMTEERKNKRSLGRARSEKEEKNKDVIPSISKKVSSTPRGTNDKKITKVGETEGCNYAKGKWVVDDSRSLYSGFGCKQWLAPMWACRLMQRQDFDFEKLRWQPKGCQMEQFEKSKFFERMQDKTLAFVGDSLGRQQFQSLMCMITGGEERSDVVDVGKQYGLVTPRGSARPNGWAYWFPSTNTTVLYYWSATLCDIEPIDAQDPKTSYALHLDRPAAFLRQYLHKFDVLVLNTGHHWNRGKFNGNRWIMYVGGAPNTDKKLIQIGPSKNFAVHSIVRWVGAQLPKYPRLKAFYRSISPRHFVNGDWNTGGSCNNTKPMSIGKLVLQDESSDFSAQSAVKGTGVKLLDITALSRVRDEGHISRFSLTASPGVQDCLHWCLPGVPDTWNEILVAQI